ncbi:MAG: hypothetical protein DI565_12080 [Ancylobacter novellus]|uniref:Uncharacterized protein n=1 Tax=Ancylobacter novellus TaxID=921 RepID=A0A2W5KAL2_ANCNO|nr:MAG: hypothetical protein DI565_12080 [Ancylobacter novellus]
MIPGCGRLVQRAAGKGFSHDHCRYHVQFKNRHGSYWKATYSAAQLAPYRHAARMFLAAYPKQKAGGLQSVWLMTLGANYMAVLEARSRSPEVKASAALARLRDHDVPALRILESYLAVCAAVEDDPIRRGADLDEYRRVQAAKAVHRLASGERKDYGEYVGYYRYSRSSGLMLRHLGAALDEALGTLARWGMDKILAEKRAADAKRLEADKAEAEQRAGEDAERWADAVAAVDRLFPVKAP